MGEARVRRPVAPDRQRGQGAGHARLLHRSGLGDGGLARDPLLQEQLRGLHARVGMEALHHRVAQEGVGERHEGHALVMGHERPHDDSLGGARPASPSLRASSVLPCV